jgi:hypothetical protein
MGVGGVACTAWRAWVKSSSKVVVKQQYSSGKAAVKQQ